jgi:O-antigen ligase
MGVGAYAPPSGTTARSGTNASVDWGLFSACLVGARGFDRFLPVNSGRLFMIVALAVLLVLVLRQLRQSLSVLLTHRLVSLMAALMVASSFLADRPAESLAATVTFVLLILYAVGREGNLPDTLHTMAIACSVAMVPSFIGLVVPIGGVRGFWGAGSSGGYAGYFPWNSSAGYCAAGVLICITILFLGGWRKWWYGPVAVAATAFLFLADAAAPWASLVAAGGALLGVSAIRKYGPLPFALLGVGLGIPLMMIYNLGEKLTLSSLGEFFGRDDKLSGRTDIWRYGFEMLGNSPMFGYGSGGIWDSNRDWGFTSANNGYLESALRWGLPVIMTLLAMIFLAGYRLVGAQSPMIALLAFGVVANMAGSQIAAPSIPALGIWLAVGFSYRAIAPAPVVTGAMKDVRRSQIDDVELHR